MLDYIKSDRLLTLAQVRDKTGLGRSTIYRMMDDRKFPRPLQAGAVAVRWRESAVDEWINALPIANDKTERKAA